MKRISWFLVLALLGMLVFTGCSGAPAPSAGGTDNRVISLYGLPEEVQITLTELKEITPKEGSAISVNSAGEEKTVAYKGAELGDILAKYGSDKTAFTGVRLVASDGYAVEVPEEILRNREIILAYEIDGAALDEGSNPVKVVVPEERAMYWVKYLAEVHLVAPTADVKLKTVRFFENELKALSVRDYDYFGTVDEAVLLTELLGRDESTKVILIGRDGLVKHELLEPAKYEYCIKYTGADAPAYLAPGLPFGMQVKNLAAIIDGDVAILFASGYAGPDGRFAGGPLLETLSEYWPDGELTLLGVGGQTETITAAVFGEKHFVLTETGVSADR